VFVHDRQTGATERISVDSAGGQTNGYIPQPETISSDGRFVAFESDASSLVPGDSNGEQDVFVHDRQTGATERVSVKSSGGQANGPSHNNPPAISADGRFVAFASFASNLVAGDSNGLLDVFVHDRQTGATERVSVDSSGGQAGGGSSGGPEISADGRFVIFGSDASNLVPGDSNGSADVFVHGAPWQNTPAGANVGMSLVDAARASRPADLTFTSVTGTGVTTVFTEGNESAPPTGFQAGTPSVYYDLGTTASYSGSIDVCIHYDGVEFGSTTPDLFHYEDDAWTKVTTSQTPATKTVCGSVTSLSPFALFASQAPTAVEALGLKARARQGSVRISWRTASEANIAGFNLFRAGAGEQPEKLNPTLVSARYGGTTRRGRYSFVDRSARHGTAYRYRLQAVGLDGRKVWAGEATARVNR
jgi:hypothetical protein